MHTAKKRKGGKRTPVKSGKQNSRPAKQAKSRVVPPATVLLAMRREELASHGCRLARIDYLLGQLQR